MRTQINKCVTQHFRAGLNPTILPQRCVPQRFSAGLNPATAPLSTKGVYVLSIQGGNHPAPGVDAWVTHGLFAVSEREKGRKHPQVLLTNTLFSPGVNAWPTESISVLQTDPVCAYYWNDAQFQHSVNQHSVIQHCVPQHFRAGLNPATAPLSTKGVYALLIQGGSLPAPGVNAWVTQRLSVLSEREKGRKRPPVLSSDNLFSPGVNARPTEVDSQRIAEPKNTRPTEGNYHLPTKDNNRQTDSNNHKLPECRSTRPMGLSSVNMKAIKVVELKELLLTLTKNYPKVKLSIEKSLN